jgi:DNA (cytosine-5)-methyltransferase 1
MTLDRSVRVKVIDMFSGIGGLTHGFVLEGFEVVAGIDIDGACRYGYEKNNGCRFIQKEIAKVRPAELEKLYAGSTVRVLVGCAPCQPFSTLNLGRSVYKSSDGKWESLDSFRRLIAKVRPEIVSMENVAELANPKKFPVFGRFLKTLRRGGYTYQYRVVDASRYGVPQHRRRLVLLASRLGSISLIGPTRLDCPVSVERAIGDLPPIRAGQASRSDSLHRASNLSSLNMRRIKATPKNGGSATSWRRDLLPECYKKKKGQSYRCTVYGRMRWNEPAPTITTQFHTLGTGRFGHPTQNRAISLREAARLQTFPDGYEFQDPGEKMKISKVAQYIGNAVPVELARAIAASVREHLSGVAT